MDIRNESQLRTIIQEIEKEVIEVVSVTVREKLKDYILEFIYFYDYQPNKVYEGGTKQPSWEFLESFRWKQIVSSMNNITKELYYAWENMTVDRVTGRHYENGQDIRSKLANMMNVNGVVGHKQRADYWNRFITEMFDEGELDKLFDSELKKRGVIM